MMMTGRSYAALEAAYRRRFWRAMLLSSAGFGLLAIGLPIGCLPASIRPDVAGYRDAQRVEPRLAPAEFPVDHIAAASARRLAQGAIELIEFELVEEATPAPDRPRPRARIGELQLLAPTQEEIVVELGENLAPQPSSLPKTVTSRFEVRRLVVPEYPAASLAANTHGLVRIKARVDPQGRVRRVTTLSNQADLLCQAAAEEALSEWRFRPLQVAGEAIWFSVVVPFRFRVEG